MIAKREIKICIPDDQYSISQENLRQFKANKSKIAFFKERIAVMTKAKIEQKKDLLTLKDRRAKVNEQIDSISKELETIIPNTYKKQIRQQSLEGIGGVLYDNLEKKLTKAFIYRILKFINSRLMEYIHEYRIRIDRNQTISKNLKDIIVNNVNWCELTE